MTRETKLSDDLAALAAAQRSRLGELPTAEELIAYRDGELPEEHAEHLRDRLAVDSDLATLYFDLKRYPDLDGPVAGGAGEALPEADVDDAWRSLASRLEGEEARVEEPEDNVVPWRGEPARPTAWGRPLLALAAVLVLSLGLSWLLSQRDRLQPSPHGNYHLVRVSRETLRDSRLEVPRDVDGLEFQIDTSGFGGVEQLEAEVLDALDEVVERGSFDVQPGEPVVFRVALDRFEEGRTYRLVVRQAGALPVEPVLRMIFSLVLGSPSEPSTPEPPRESTDVPVVVPGACGDLDAEVDRAVELRRDGARAEAEAIYNKVLAKASARSCTFQAARARNGRAGLAILESQPVDALRELERAAAAVSESAPYPSEDPADFIRRVELLTAALEHHRGGAFLRLGWLNEARDALRRADALYRRNGSKPETVARTLLQSARVSRLQGGAEEARSALREALDLFGDTAEGGTRAAIWQELTRLELDAERFDAAERALGEAVKSLAGSEDSIARANVTADRGELALRRERWSEGLRWADEALALGKAAGTPDLNLEAHARYLRSVALSRLGDLAGARRAAERGLALLEALRDAWQDLGLSFFASRQVYTRHHLDLTMAADDLQDAWSVFEGYRARGLLESSSSRARQSESAEGPVDLSELRQRRRELLDAVWALDTWDPETGEAALIQREARFRDRRLALRELQAEQRRAAGRDPLPAMIDPVAAAGMLGSETLALVFAGGVEKIHVLALGPGGRLEGLSLEADQQRLGALVEELADSYEPTVPAEARGRAEGHVQELSRALLEPLADRLDQFRRLVLVVDAPLERLPFEVLRHPRTGRWLIESHEISYLPSFSVLASLRQRSGAPAGPAGLTSSACPPASSELLAMGDPILASRDERWPAGATDPRSADEALALQRLPATAAEVESIAGLYPVGATTVALGPEATRERFLAEAAAHRVIHVASHARSDAEAPERSKIALSCVDAVGQVPAESCDIYFEDIVALDLCGRIVVASACETAGGRSLAGEGVLGLPRAFLHAGASTVVASLWRVADGPTAELMRTFHRQLREGTAPAAALRQAKLERIAAGRPASEWAAFLLFGD